MEKLQFITHSNARYSYVDGARMALDGGCRWIQLRMKGATDEQVLRAAAIVQPWCRELGATFIIDDHVALVRQLHADGVHLGKSDMPVAEARRILGPHYIIGGTANTIDDIINLYRQGADYIGCGPFRFTTTKQNLAPVLGLDGYRSIIKAMREHGITLPVVAIGGITIDDVPAIMSTGVSGIAVSGVILNAPDPVWQTRRVNEELRTKS